MAKIKKLGQPFLPKTEATAASQNEQNAKIDEIISNFTLQDPDAEDQFTIALPVYKGENLCKITKIGSNLSVDAQHVLNATTEYTLPSATTTKLGGVKIGGGLTVPNDGDYKDKLSVNVAEPIYIKDDGTLGIRTDDTLSVETDSSNPGQKKLHVTVEPGSGGKTYGATDPIKITTGTSGAADKIGLNYNTTDFAVDEASKDLKLKYRITGVKGPISKNDSNQLKLDVAAPLKVPTEGTNKDKLTLGYSTSHGLTVTSEKLDIKVASASQFGVIKLGEGLLVNDDGVVSAQALKVSNSVLYCTYDNSNEHDRDFLQNQMFVFKSTKQDFTEVQFNDRNEAQIIGSNKNMMIYLPTCANKFKITDSRNTSITTSSDNYEYKGFAIVEGALYRVIYYHSSNLNDTFTVTKYE